MLELYKLKMIMACIKFIIFLLIPLALTSCKSVVNVVNYGKWNVNSQYTSSIFTKLPHPNKKLYFVQNNTTGQTSFDLTFNQTRDLLIAKGFEITNNPEEAEFKIIVNFKNFNRIDGKNFALIKDYWTTELSTFLLDKQILALHKKNQVMQDVANYARYSEGDAKISITTRENMTDSIRVNNNGSQNLVSSIINAYKDFDISGLIAGNLIGYAIGTPQAIIYGTIAGGFIFEMASKLTEPRSYLLISDIQISEKSLEPIFETDKRSFTQDDSSVRRSEFSNQVNYINYHTSLFLLATKVLGNQQQAAQQISSSVSQIISSSVGY
jgi:hypothetical protein